MVDQIGKLNNMEHTLYTELMNSISTAIKISIEKHSGHSLNEMARIDDPHIDKIPEKVKIYVYGENDEQATKIPHFHVIGNNFEFEVHIRHIHNLNIWRTKYIDKKLNKNTWNTRTNIRNAIIKWLDKPNTDFAPLTNATVIVAQWNANNPTHKISQSYKD